MAFYNGVYETSTTTGTGTYTLAGAFVASGALGTAYQTFAVVGNGNQCYYRAQDNENGGWEEGIGTYTASGTTLARTTVLESSSGVGTPVNWPAGTRQIFLVEPAETKTVKESNTHWGIGVGAVPDPDYTPYDFGVTLSTLSLNLDTTAPPAGSITDNTSLAILHTVKLGATIATNSDFETILAVMRTDPTGTHGFTGGMVGFDLQLRHEASYNIGAMYGFELQVNNRAGGTVDAAYGFYAPITNNTTGTITTAYGFYTYVFQAGSGSVVTSYGIFVDFGGGTGYTNVYGCFVADQSQSTTSGQNWNYYSEDVTGTSKNFFGGVVSVGAASPNASAKVQIDSTTKGFLPPRMTTTQKNAIGTPAEGLVVHDSTLHTPWFYNGSAWTAFGGGVWPATLTAHALYAGNGTSAPNAVGPGSTDGVPLVATGSSTDPAFRSTSLKLDSTFGVITVDADAAPVAINWATSNWHSTTLTASRQITFTGDVDGGAITIIFKSGGTGAWTPTWPATVKWLGGVAPTLTNTSAHWDIVSIKRESSGNYIGTYSLNYF